MKALDLAKKYTTILNENGINTPLRLAHFFAQLDHESGGFVYLKELGNDAYFKKYEGRKDLGNTVAGDSIKYKGRGFLQITGRSNYTQLSKDTGVDYLSNPKLLENEADAMISAIWFWSKNKLNAICDKDDVVLLTKRINGGKNGLEERKNKLAKYKAAFK